MSRSSAGHTIRIGAVAYDPKVVTIWEGFVPYFAKHGPEIDYVPYSNYDAQVRANLSGELDIAWNSPLAWVKSQIASQGRVWLLVCATPTATSPPRSSYVPIRPSHRCLI